MTEKTVYKCFNCEHTETEMPLVSLRHNGNVAWVCTQCMPILIHHPEKLTGKINVAEKTASVPTGS